MRRIALVIGSVLCAFALVTGASAHGKGHGNSGNNHGATVAPVAQSTCVAPNPHNPKVSNHGQCVKQAAHGTPTAVASGTPTATATATATTTSTSGTSSVKKHAKHTHAKHAHAKHADATHKHAGSHKHS